MKILVYGAGPLGSLFAARLHVGGHDVSILARGQRLADLREYGIVLEDVHTKRRTVTRVDAVAELAPADEYDLVLVIMRKNNALGILPILAANGRTPNILFLMNNAAGPAALINALGSDRVLMGFPMAAGYIEGHVVHCLAATANNQVAIPLGEADGRIRTRTRQVAAALERMPGYRVELQPNMDAWLKTHVALISPIANALYLAGGDHRRLARTRDGIALFIRAVREGIQVLRALDIPVIPAKLRVFAWIPEPLLVLWLRGLFASEQAEVTMARHANAARDEMQQLADEFRALAAQTFISTPALDRLRNYIDPQTPPLPEGSAEMPLDWRGVGVGCAVLAGLLAVLLVILGVRRDR